MIRLWVFIGLFGFLSAIANAFLYNGSAASVGKSLITVQDAYFYRALQQWKEGQGDPFQIEEGESLRRTVQKVVFEEMVYSEMLSLKFEVSPKREVEEKIRTLRTRSRASGATLVKMLRRFGKSETSVTEVLWRSAQVERFLARKVETLTPVITQAEAERYYRQGKTESEGRFKGSDFESLKPSIILLLKKQRMQKGLEEWVKFLKEKYAVVNHLES